jgi:Domain of unknown function (DUF4178)
VIPKLSGLNCPSCGAALEIRSFGNALTVVCPKCLAVLDAKDPNLRILQEARSREKIPPLIPLGSRGTLSGVQYEAIGFQVRTVGEPDDSYQWREYLLFNPYHGFRYLTEYNGHWNFVRTIQALPEPVSARRVRYEGESFTRISGGEAGTSYVIGEFPWQVRVGEMVQVQDYIHPPRLLSSESTADETVWSLGTYMAGAEIWKAFALPGAPLSAVGVFENQPSPYPADTGGLWKMAALLIVAALLLTAIASALGGRGDVYSQSLALTNAPVVTPPFEVGGFTSNLQIVTVNRGTESVYIRYSLIDQKTGLATTFGRDVYREDTARVPSVAPGRYYIRAEADRYPASVDMSVRRGVPSMGFFWITALLLLAPPAVRSWRRLGFERRRWQENS